MTRRTVIEFAVQIKIKAKELKHNNQPRGKNTNPESPD